MHVLHMFVSWVHRRRELASLARRLLRSETSLFSKTIQGLRHDNPIMREKAARDLSEWMERGLNPVEGVEALRFAAQPFPPRMESTWRGYDVLLVELAQSDPHPSYVHIIRDSFAMYSIEARWEALILLSAIPDRGAAYAFTDLLSLAMRQHDFNVLPVAPLTGEPRFPDIFFPDLFDYLDAPQHAESVWSVTLRFCEEGLLRASNLRPVCDKLVADYRALKVALFSAQRSDGTAWMWEESYSGLRYKAALLLDLMGFVRSDSVITELVEALAFTDPRLKAFAMLSLIRHDRVPRFHHRVAVAQSPETRNLLMDRLRAMGREDLFPIEYSTQDAFAESDLASWLVFPTELGRAPDHIELMQVEVMNNPEDTEGGELEIYLFRFRVKKPHWASEKGWMAGISGPFPCAGDATTDSLGATFSCFESWDSQTPVEHLESILGLFDSRS